MIQAKSGRQVSVDLCGDCGQMPQKVMDTFPKKGKRSLTHRRPVLTEREVRAQIREK